MPWSDKERAREGLREWRRRNPDRDRENKQRYRQRVRLRVLSHYSGGGDPECACCGVTELIFLTLDHIDGNGAAARRAIGSRGGITYYLHLIREKFPEGYRVLCWNCNAAYGQQGSCPHQEQSEKVYALVR